MYRMCEIHFVIRLNKSRQTALLYTSSLRLKVSVLVSPILFLIYLVSDLYQNLQHLPALVTSVISDYEFVQSLYSTIVIHDQYDSTHSELVAYFKLTWFQSHLSPSPVCFGHQLTCDIIQRLTFNRKAQKHSFIDFFRYAL